MKTAISIPDAIFEEAEALAKRLGKSRSQLYAEAVGDYVARHDDKTVTDAMNAALHGIEGEPPTEFGRLAARRMLEATES